MYLEAHGIQDYYTAQIFWAPIVTKPQTELLKFKTDKPTNAGYFTKFFKAHKNNYYFYTYNLEGKRSELGALT